MRLRRAALKIFLIVLSAFLASLVAFSKTKNKFHREEEDAEEAEELQEQENSDLLMTTKKLK